MSDHQISETAQPADPQGERPVEAGLAADKAETKKQKKKARVRSAWISFVGRILAQVIGSLTAVGLSLLVLDVKYKMSGGHPASGGDAVPAQWSAPLGPPRPPGEVSIAVLPLENFSADPTHESFADGMTEEVITNLSKVDSLRVVSRTSSMHFKGQRKPLREIAHQLGVHWIVEGSIARVGTRVRITAQLIDADTDLHAWAEEYDRSVTDDLALQGEVAGTIARAISAVLPLRGWEARLQQPHVVHPGDAPPRRDRLLTLKMPGIRE